MHASVLMLQIARKHARQAGAHYAEANGAASNYRYVRSLDTADWLCDGWEWALQDMYDAGIRPESMPNMPVIRKRYLAEFEAAIEAYRLVDDRREEQARRDLWEQNPALYRAVFRPCPVAH
jgi:hypothetical protein